MPQHTPTVLACEKSHHLLLEAIRLRDRLLDRLDEDDLDVLSRFDRLYRATGTAEKRVMRRRVRWLVLQKRVFEEIGDEARAFNAAAREAAYGRANELRELLASAALRSLVPGRK